MDVNKVILIGRLGQDPVVRETQSGKTACNFSVATTYYQKGHDGEKREETTWHDIVSWGKLGSFIGERAVKGSRVYVEGRLKSREYETQNGTKVKTCEVVCIDFKFLERKRLSEEIDGNR